MIADSLGRDVPLQAPPRRIVSLVPSLTEYLFAIGAGDRLVGVTDFCTEPAEHVPSLVHVGGTKNPDCSRIADLNPDLVLASREENRLRDVTTLESPGIPVYVTDICSVAGALEQLTTLAHVLDAPQQAAALLHELQTTLQQQEAYLRETQTAARRVLVFIWRDPWMAAGGATYAHDLLRVCGAENVALHLPGRYPRASLETFLALQPEIILLPDEPYRFTRADQAAFAPMNTPDTQALQAIILCDGKLLTWYGPRTAAALRFFRQMFHPGSPGEGITS
jgi:ABC-type Fe3+-hydroxamate transport system substrate-binding protein